MPKVTDEHKEQRKREIVDACEKIYTEKGFYGVTIKEISTATSFTRPAIYTYFETKDEILLALLIREYEKWCGALAYAVTQIDGNRESAAATKNAIHVVYSFLAFCSAFTPSRFTQPSKSKQWN